MRKTTTTYILALLLLAFMSGRLSAQSNIDAVLAEVAKNNKTIKANEQYWEAQKLQYKTGISLYNPTVEYDFLSGSPSSAGNQHDLTVAQSFDFPTAYVKKSQLAKQQTAQVEFKLTATKQDVLLNAKKICIELVYRNKLQQYLAERKRNIEKLQSDFKARLDKGDGNVLDVNKATLQLIEIRKQLQDNISASAQLNEQLTALNGGNRIVFADTVYSLNKALPAFEQLEADYENSDPLRKSLEQEKVITKKQLEVAKSLWLPKMELGYHYQGILGQTYNGVHTGITLPLWENKNTVKAQQSKLLFADLEIQDHKNEHYYELKAVYERYLNLQITLAEYQQVFTTINNTALLNKALALGQITTIEYFMEAAYYNNAFNSYLQMERELNEAHAELYKYKL